jgi:mannose-6-phosphate isomerase-like protein (cupin superfamily)
MGGFDAIEVQGSEREHVLAKIGKQIKSWGLTLPAVTPLPLHFGLNRFEEIGETEFWVANETGHGYCGKFLFVFDGQTCPYHRHRVKHETFFIVKGTLKMKVGEEERMMREGDLLVMPPGLGHSFTGVGPALVLEISMPSVPKDSFFDETQIGEHGVI